MEIKLLGKSKLMMLFSAWEDCQWSFMMAARLMLWTESHLEDTLYLSFVKKLRKHQKENNHYQNLCSSFFEQEDIQVITNVNNLHINGEEEEI